MITAILTTWKRHHNIDANLRTLLNEKEISEIIVWDNSGNFKTDLPVTVINSNHNFGANIRFAIASTAKNDIIFTVDDDIKLKAGIISDLLKYYSQHTAIGIYGRNFDDSYKSGEHILAEKINRPIPVEHIVGYLLLMPKWILLNQDYNKMTFTCGEVELFGSLLKKNLVKVIVPTTKFENLHDQQDEHALSLKPGADVEYERVWSKYYKL